MHKVKQAACTYVYLYISVYMHICIHLCVCVPAYIYKKSIKIVQEIHRKKDPNRHHKKNKTKWKRRKVTHQHVQAYSSPCSSTHQWDGETDSNKSTYRKLQMQRTTSRRGAGAVVGAAAAGAGRGLFLLICNALWTLFLALVLVLASTPASCAFSIPS